MKPIKLIMSAFVVFSFGESEMRIDILLVGIFIIAWGSAVAQRGVCGGRESCCGGRESQRSGRES